MDWDMLLNQNGGLNRGRGERIPFVVTYHPAFNLIYNIVSRLQHMLDASAEHKKVFPNKPLVSFRRAKNLKDNLVRAKLAPLQQEDQLKGCYQCGKSRCQVCEHMSEGDKFVCHVTGKEYRINSTFDCDSSGVVYLLSCKVCGMQYVGSTFTPFRTRFNDYKSCSRRFDKGELVNQADSFRHFLEVGHHGFLKDVTFQVVDKLFGDSRVKEGFWQFKLDTFAPKGLNVRFVDS